MQVIFLYWVWSIVMQLKILIKGIRFENSQKIYIHIPIVINLPMRLLYAFMPMMMMRWWWW